eukprot:scaffold42377_cov63-Phaeocystis_antarctica.AAC.4
MQRTPNRDLQRAASPSGVRGPQHAFYGATADFSETALAAFADAFLAGALSPHPGGGVTAYAVSAVARLCCPLTSRGYRVSKHAFSNLCGGLLYGTVSGASEGLHMRAAGAADHGAGPPASPGGTATSVGYISPLLC